MNCRLASFYFCRVLLCNAPYLKFAGIKGRLRLSSLQKRGAHEMYLVVFLQLVSMETLWGIQISN